MNNKYLLISILFLTGLSVHSFDGHFEHHNEDGSLFCQYSLKEGKYDGVCTFYWSNGNTAHEAFF